MHTTTELAAEAMERGGLNLDSSASAALEGHDWPGNIRQLRHAMRYACAITDGHVIRKEHFPPDLFTGLRVAAPADGSPTALREAAYGQPVRPPAAPPPPINLTDSEAMLRAQMMETLRRNQWQVKLSARELSMSRATFYRKLARFNIVPPNRRE